MLERGVEGAHSDRGGCPPPGSAYVSSPPFNLNSHKVWDLLPIGQQLKAMNTLSIPACSQTLVWAYTEKCWLVGWLVGGLVGGWVGKSAKLVTTFSAKVLDIRLSNFKYCMGIT